MKRIKNGLTVIIIISLGIILSSGCSKSKGAKRVYEKNPVTVKIQPVTRGPVVNSLNYKGSVFPWSQANICPEMSGRILRIYKKQGDRVKKGELLAEMDTTTLNLQLKQAKAGLAVAEAAHKDALLNVNRLEKLFEKKAISSMQLEKAQLSLEVADTEKKSAQANVEVIRHNLNYAYMRAPFDGIITAKNADEGDVINPMMGMSASVLTLMDVKKVKIILDAPSEDIEKIKLHQPCAVQVATLKDDRFNGEIYSQNLSADPVSKTFKLEVKVENPDLKIKSGVFAQVRIEIARKDNCLILPISALIEENNTSFVVVNQDGKSKYKNVKVGVRNEHEFEILEGLSEGEPVVVEGNYDLQEGTLINSEGVKRHE